MKVDRRSFLSLVVGGAAGIHITPLPWKLIDDVSIWTQNWPWTPSPEKGEASFVHSTCSLCPGGCGITVRKINDRAVKIEGMKGHPINDGGLCILGLSGLQLLYGPTRIGGPLKRVGARGEGRWEPITWSEAIKSVATRLGELRSAGQPHTVGCIMGSDRGTVPGLFSRFLTVYGSPNFVRTPSIQDGYEFILDAMHGRQASVGFDAEHADFVLSFGSGLLDGWGSPVRMFRAHSGWRNKGVKLVQVEPRLSNTAAKASQWIPVKPGTEAALALGIAHVMIDESMVDQYFTSNHTFGFDDWTDEKGQPRQGLKTLIMDQYHPDHVETVTGVKRATLLDLARQFAKSDRPLALCGRGQGQTTPGAAGVFVAVHTLNALAGRIHKTGGVWSMPEPDYIDWPDPEMDGVAARGMQEPRIDGAGGEELPHTRYLLNRFFEKTAENNSKLVQALLISGANPLYSTPDVAMVKKALNNIPLVVSFSSYMDETAAYADLILPNHVYLERYEDLPAPAGFPKPFIGLSKPVAPPQLNTRHAGDTILGIAKALGGAIARAFPWKDYESCLKESLGDKWTGLVETGCWFDSGFKAAPWRNAFDTGSKKFEFVSSGNNGPGQRFAGPEIFSPPKPEGDGSTYPLVLIPYDIMRLTAAYIGNTPFMTKTVDETTLKGQDSFVEVNPKTAAAAGLTQGCLAVLTTPRGSAKVRVNLFEGIMPGLVAMPRGLGHTAYDDYLAHKGINFNALIGPVQDPASGMDAAWGIRAKLVRA